MLTLPGQVENEWFYDEAKQTLYLIPNATATGSAPPTEDYVAVVLETLISINGTKASPVKDITVQGISFRDAADIVMKPWGVPVSSLPLFSYLWAWLLN
jgi:hypothetical protein